MLGLICRMPLKFLYSCLFGFILTACATTTPTVNDLEVKITIEKNLNQDWTAYIEFPRPTLAAPFAYSAGGYHSQNWIPASPNTKIKNISGLDTILFESPAQSARFVFSPRKVANARRLLPSQKFSDGGLALSIAEFVVMPMKNAEAVRGLGGNMSNWRGRIPKYRLTVKDDGPIFTNGEQYDDEYVIEYKYDDAKLIHIDSASYIKTDQFNAILDRKLPVWISERFESDAQTIFKSLAEAWGQPLAKRTDITFIMEDFNTNYTRASGAAMNGDLLVLRVGGEGYQRENEEKRETFLLLLAHETAHIFQARGNGDRNSLAPWMSEGSANVMSRDILYRQSVLSDAKIQRDYRESYTNCVDILMGGFAIGRTNSQSRYYDCGNFMSLMTDKALPEHSLYDFWNKVLEQSKGKPVTSKLYFKTLKDMGANPELVEGMKMLVETKIDKTDFLNRGSQKGVSLRSLMEASGLNPVFNKNGELIHVEWQ